MRRLLWDAETSPNVVLSWRAGYKINISYENILEERKIICIGYKWHGEKKVHSLEWDTKQNDRSLLEEFIPILNSADESVAHFGDSFDLPWVKGRCLFHRIPTLPKYQTIDTLKLARANFYLNSGKLDYLAQFLGIGGKLRTENGLWRRVLLERDAKALAFMVKYCKRDVLILEQVYDELAKACPHKTHVGVLDGHGKWSCAKCGSEKVKTSKKKITAAGATQWQMQCNSCGGYYSISNKVHNDYLEK